MFNVLMTSYDGAEQWSHDFRKSACVNLVDPDFVLPEHDCAPRPNWKRHDTKFPTSFAR